MCNTNYLRTGFRHLPSDSIDNNHDSEDSSLRKFHQSVLDEIAHCHWGWVGYTARDPSKPVTQTTTPDGTSTPDGMGTPGGTERVRGIDPYTLFFKRDDVILLVDGGRLSEMIF